VKDFTSLVIIVEIDNILVGYTDVDLDELHLDIFDKPLKE